MKPLNHIAYALGCLLMPVALASCSVIDEVMSGCEPKTESEQSSFLTYDLQLETYMTRE